MKIRRMLEAALVVVTFGLFAFVWLWMAARRVESQGGRGGSRLVPWLVALWAAGIVLYAGVAFTAQDSPVGYLLIALSQLAWMAALVLQWVVVGRIWRHILGVEVDRYGFPVWVSHGVFAFLFMPVLNMIASPYAILRTEAAWARRSAAGPQPETKGPERRRAFAWFFRAQSAVWAGVALGLLARGFMDRYVPFLLVGTFLAIASFVSALVSRIRGNRAPA